MKNAMHLNRHAKIVCTLGPKSSSEQMIDKLIAAGMNVARLNFSHGTHDTHRQVYTRLRQRARVWQRPLAILQDLQGPKIRLSQLREEQNKEIQEGQLITLTLDPARQEEFVFLAEYPYLTRDVRPHDTILLDDGNISLEVQKTKDLDVECRVIQGGLLRSRVGMNLPQSRISTPALSDKDLIDLRLGLELQVDYVALSFVRTAKDIEQLRDIIGPNGPHIIAKIERPEAVQHLEAIIDAADGIMVARGDLGVELDPQKVPIIQKHAIELANHRSKPVIVATQMLESMIESMRPTRAEASDVANAIFDGADAVMLSAETASGQHPIRTVEMMASIIREVESSARYWQTKRPAPHADMNFAHAIARAAAAAESELQVSTIVVHTMTGYTARVLSSFKPKAQIVALSPSESAKNRMNLYWGTTAISIQEMNNTDQLIAEIEQVLVEQKIANPGDNIIICANIPAVYGQGTNFLKLHRLKN